MSTMQAVRDTETADVEAPGGASRPAVAPRPVYRWTPSGLFVSGADGAERPVRAVRCFPWLEPDRYVSVRDLEDGEVAFIRDLADLPPEPRAAVERALGESGFVMDIERILSIEEEFEIRNWRVVTRQGPRTLQTRRDEWPRVTPGGVVLVQDVAGDLYRVAEPEKLDETSRRHLHAFVG
jgi:hypothetical protein